jgi:hypothetical protein
MRFKRISIFMAGAVALLALSGCTGPKPIMHECGGNNCHFEKPESIV